MWQDSGPFEWSWTNLFIRFLAPPASRPFEDGPFLYLDCLFFWFTTVDLVAFLHVKSVWEHLGWEGQNPKRELEVPPASLGFDVLPASLGFDVLPPSLVLEVVAPSLDFSAPPPSVDLDTKWLPMFLNLWARNYDKCWALVFCYIFDPSLELT